MGRARHLAGCVPLRLFGPLRCTLGFELALRVIDIVTY
jgi:hypothetical protein